jgi:hypothetical protein
MAEYAHAKSDFFRRLAEDVLSQCLPHIQVRSVASVRSCYYLIHLNQDQTVSMRWCNEWLTREELGAAI